MSTPVSVCMYVCVSVCATTLLPRCLALVGYKYMSVLCVCIDRIICLPLSYSSSSRRMHPGLLLPTPMPLVPCVSGPLIDLRPRVRGALFPLV